jgi:hypothetical protein
MFIETYYDERHMVPAGSREPAIPYPELAGEELRLWQTYLPVATELGKYALLVLRPYASTGYQAVTESAKTAPV